MKRTRKIASAAATLLFAGAAFLYFRPAEPPAAVETPSASPVAVIEPEIVSAPEPAVDSEVPRLTPVYVDTPYEARPVSIDLAAERPAVAETRSMYEAHAYLRTPEVADPDSTANLKVRSALLNNVLALAERHEARLAAEREAERPAP